MVVTPASLVNRMLKSVSVSVLFAGNRGLQLCHCVNACVCLCLRLLLVLSSYEQYMQRRHNFWQ